MNYNSQMEQVQGGQIYSLAAMPLSSLTYIAYKDNIGYEINDDVLADFRNFDTYEKGFLDFSEGLTINQWKDRVEDLYTYHLTLQRNAIKQEKAAYWSLYWSIKSQPLKNVCPAFAGTPEGRKQPSDRVVDSMIYANTASGPEIEQFRKIVEEREAIDHITNRLKKSVNTIQTTFQAMRSLNANERKGVDGLPFAT